MWLIITIIIIMNVIIIPIIAKKDEKVEGGKDKIIFRFDKKNRNSMMILTIVLSVISIIIGLIIAFKEGKNNSLIAELCFLPFIIISFYLFLLMKNKKVIFSNDIIYYYNVFGIQKEYHIQEIREAIEIPLNGIKIIFNDGKKIKIDMQMTNYKKIKEILDKNHIVRKDKCGNDVSKGW